MAAKPSLHRDWVRVRSKKEEGASRCPQIIPWSVCGRACEESVQVS